MPDTEENIWGHLLLSKFWFHEEIGCGLQETVKAEAHENRKATMTSQCGLFLLHPNADFIHAHSLLPREIKLHTPTVVLQGSFFMASCHNVRNTVQADTSTLITDNNYFWFNSIFKINHYIFTVF